MALPIAILYKCMFLSRHWVEFIPLKDIGYVIDYRDYVYGIGYERAPPIVMYNNVLEHSPEYLVLAKI